MSFKNLENKVQRPGFWAISSLIIIAPLIWLQNENEDDLFDPAAIFLTWQQDPTTTMTIDWHTLPEDGERESIVHYQIAGDDPGGLEITDNGTWMATEGTSHPFPHTGRTIHRVELTGLEPGTSYRFRFGEDSKVYSFQTIRDDLDEPVRFATGGDAGYGENFEKMNRVVMDYEPDFIVWGGDLSYANEDPAGIDNWYGWFDGIKEVLIYEDGRVVPIVVTIGNHELFGERRLYRRGHPLYRPDDHEDGPGPTEEEAQAYMDKFGLENDQPTYFFDLFAFPGDPTFNVLDFSDYMSLIALDTDHYFDVPGEQTQWLEDVLAARQDRIHLFPVYHVPAYPSHRSFDGRTSRRIRENWVPLFEQYGVRVAFENHDHAYKRTHPIRDGSVVPDGEGVVYIGDGAWVAGPRDVNNWEEWYMNEFQSLNHAIIVTLHGNTQDYIMVSSDGDVFDSYNTSGPLLAPRHEPDLVSPLSAPRTEFQPEFEWTSVTDATEYRMQIAIGNFATGLLFDSTTQHTNLLYPETLEDDTEYRWRVRGQNESGDGPWTVSPFTTIREDATSADGSELLPAEFTLFHNYPNPFNPSTTIRYGLPVSAHVELRVYDVIGREVALLVNEEQSAGYHTTIFNSESLHSGVYIFRFKAIPSGSSGADAFMQTRSMTFLK